MAPENDQKERTCKVVARIEPSEKGKRPKIIRPMEQMTVKEAQRRVTSGRRITVDADSQEVREE